jgi:hypothetical protein
MKTSFADIDIIFDFKGLWDLPSKCGLKIFRKEDKSIVVVSELYRDNPGTSITQAALPLIEQICETFNLSKTQLIYIQRNPEMNSKLSFYTEEFFIVELELENNCFVNPIFKKISFEDYKKICQDI